MRAFRSLEKSKLLAVGTSGIIEEEDLARIRLVNLLCYVAAGIVLLVGGVLCYVLHGKASVVVPLTLEFIANASVLWWNHKKRFVTAAWVLYAIQCVMIAYLAIVLGRLLQLELVIILLIAITYLIFKTPTDRKLAVAAALVDLIVLETVYYINGGESSIPVSYNAAFLIHALVLLSVIGIILLVSAPYVRSHDTNAGLKRANHFIKIFIAQITHELRTPLDSIHQAMQLLRSEIRKDRHLRNIQPLVDIGWTVSSTAKNIVNNVLDMAEIEAGKSPTVVNEAFKVRPFFEKISEVYQIIAQREKMTLGLFIDKNMPEAVFGDPLGINQIITNLMANAFKYGKKGGRVSLEIRRSGTRWQIVVFNTGPAIPPEKLDSIFDPFITGRTGHIQGSGLGLFIVKSKLLALNGAISVESVPDQGTTFIVTLPLWEARIRDLPDGAGLDEDQLDLHKAVVWVAEDDKLTAFLYTRFLNDMGCAFTVAKNGQELLGIAKEKCPGDIPDIIILDCHMPVLSGEETIIQLKRLPGLDHVPVIVTTGDIYSDTVHKMLAAGANAYLKKPIDHLALKKTMMLYLKKLPQN
jgi:signal transduction histidine kinase/CheY-like chemotaxis protein